MVENVYKVVHHRGQNGRGWGRLVDWVAVIGDRHVAGFGRKRDALEAVRQAAKENANAH